MPVFTLRSKRHQLAKKNPDVYQYDTLPQEFRIQVVHILGSTLGEYVGNSFGRLSEPTANLRWRALFSQYTRAKGMLYLGKDPMRNVYIQCTEYLLGASAEDALDFIDYAFHFMGQDLRQDTMYHEYIRGQGSPFNLLDSAIEELNQRFQEHNIGYQFQNGQLMKQTDHYVHDEVVLPALTLLMDPQFRGAQDEFLSAHRHYREQRYKEAVADALKAFESTIKSILDERQWEYDPHKDTASTLLKILFKDEYDFVPSYMQEQFTGLRVLLGSNVVTVRNKTSGHGQGAKPVVLPKYIAEYALHTAAANILFLVNAYEEYKKTHE